MSTSKTNSKQKQNEKATRTQNNDTENERHTQHTKRIKQRSSDRF